MHGTTPSAVCVLVAFALSLTCGTADAVSPGNGAFSELRNADTSTVMADMADSKALTCIAYWPEGRYGAIGYNHIVHLQSSCPAAAVCRVSTNVNPQSVDVAVKPGEHVEVLTFRGSPAREFTPKVTCAFHT
jgi:hypothetical protein